MKVFVEFVLRLIFVDLKLSQNPYMPTTNVKPILKGTETHMCPNKCDENCGHHWGCV